MNKIEIYLSVKKLTKGTVVYEETGDQDKTIPSVYIRKTALPNPPPLHIAITIEENN